VTTAATDIDAVAMQHAAGWQLLLLLLLLLRDSQV
jgi:hypothetical protein